jgi:pimeloyl-ACP methyl ester carboxylesterase
MMEEILQKDVLLGYRHYDRRNRRAVLFVHGFTGGWRATWRDGGAGASFLELMARDQNLADFDVFSFSFKTTYLVGAPIGDIAVQLHQAINQSLRGYQLVLLAHSMGGLVCMRYLLDRLEHVEPLPVTGLLLYGTPTTGTELARVAKILALGLNLGGGWLGRLFARFLGQNPQIGELESASAFLQKIHDGWALRVVNGGEPELDSRGRAWIPVRVVTGIEDWVVPKHSAKSVYGEIDWHPLNFGHVDLVKPARDDDPRYLAAADFLAKCRDSKNFDVQARLRALSDSVWKERERKLVRDWEVDIELTGEGAGLDPFLRDADYVACEMKKCQYTTIQHAAEFRFGISLEEIDESQLWERQPDYVHQLAPSSISEDERGRYVRAFDQVLNKHKADLSAAWGIFFPSFTAAVRDAANKRYPLLAGEVERVGRGLLRKYFLPPDAARLLGEEVTLELQFQSVTPHASSSLLVVFPWLTHGCRGRMKITEPIDSLSLVSALRGERPVDVKVSQGELNFRAPGLVLPLSWAEARWHRHSVESDLRGFLGEKVPHIQAGHHIAKDIYEWIRQFVKRLRDFRDEELDTLSIEENYVINELLYVIAESLPPHSIWLGVSHLTFGWQETDADPKYRKFVQKVQERCRKGDLKVMRLYCAPSEEDLKSIRNHLDLERAAGIAVRTLTGEDVPRDMTLLWSASDYFPLDGSIDQPARLLQYNQGHNAEAICGMEFHTWLRRSLNRMSLYSPRSSGFEKLATDFDDYWGRKEVVRGAPLQGPHLALKKGKGKSSGKGEGQPESLQSD